MNRRIVQALMRVAFSGVLIWAATGGSRIAMVLLLSLMLIGFEAQAFINDEIMDSVRELQNRSRNSRPDKEGRT